MSHLVALAAPMSGAHTVRRYAGFGIRGADIPATGDQGGSPVLNDGISPASEYYWRLVTPPSSGIFVIYPDLSFSYDTNGVANGDYTAVYELFEGGFSAGTAPISLHVGPYFVIGAASQQNNQAAAAAVKQTHLLGVADSQQLNQASASGVSQASTTFISAADSTQINQAAAVAIRQMHLVGITDSQQLNQASAGSVSQSSITFVSAADSAQANQASAAAVRQIHLVAVADSQQVNMVAAAAVAQSTPGAVTVADSQQVNQASSAAIRQTHLVGMASSQQANRASAAWVGDGSQPVAPAVANLTVTASQATRVGVAFSPVNTLLREIDLSNTYYKGGAVRLSARVAGPDNVDFDPASLILEIRFDAGPVTTLTYGVDPEIVRDRTGRYHADIVLANSGTFHFRFEAGTPNGAGEGKIPVAAGRFN